MLESSEAFSGFAVDDTSRAKEFYGGMLGLEVYRGERPAEAPPRRRQ